MQVHSKIKVLFFISGLCMGSIACKKEEKTATPSYRPLTEAVYASGQVLPKNEYTVYAAANGYLIEKVVEAGDTVGKGQLLFKIGGEQQKIKAQNAYEQYQIARSGYGPALQELEASLANAKARLSNDSVNLTRYRNLYENQATTQQQYDKSLLAYQTSKNEYIALQNRLVKTRKQLQAELQNAQSQYRIASEQSADYTIKSEIDGMVYELFKEEGELVKLGEPLAKLGKNDQLYLKLQVDELDIDKIIPGQKILVTIDTYHDQVVEAKVSKIYPVLNGQSQTFRVDAHFTSFPKKKLYAGLTAEANIIIQHKNKALTIPRAYLIGEDSVQVKRNGENQTVKIKKGAENFEYIEVVAGLDSTSVLLMK